MFEAPLIVGTVGGVTTLHPTASMCLKMLNVKSANELSRIIAAVGLVQNLGALRALTTVGVVEGHMKLHIKNLTLGAGANEREIPIVQKKLEEILEIRKRISLSNAVEVLKELRAAEQVRR
jgi:hydroxymethylglutaryl-CoA reductase